MTTSSRLVDDPLWYKDAVIYEVHVRAFHDANGDGIGDFKGLTQKLDYLQDLGITAVWLLPFYPSPLRDGGYDIADYTGVHPDYGTKEDFLEFLKEAHARGIRVVTELVINHTSIDHAWFQAARNAPPGSPERELYVWSDSPDRYSAARIIFKDFETSNWAWDPVARAYYWHRFYSHQPDLNFDNPRVHELIFEVLDHWMSLGVDAVRLDAIPYLYEREGTTCENLDETHGFLKKLRAHVDGKYQNRMLLAEANQWPADAAKYFGDGDECHMNFHFPLMPRLFMSVQLEDSFPVVDILQQTPKIPPACQWATFLRNHDELTLEMVTEEDRDYMYRVYAREHRARINLGIRRRLAPLLGDRRRLELLNAMLFSLPGTPVLYYGDEIGMGDNIYLGDRDGVRTPMQWNSDRNGGFSRANPQKLYLPIVVDPEYHYEAVNVEAHQANASSLLWWMKHLIAMRKETQVLSRGEFDFVDPDNAKVLAFVRQHGEERLLFVANLSRFPQHASLHLSSYKGTVPVELLGRSRFPRVETDRWDMTLGPYDYFWFELTPQASPEAAAEVPLTTTDSWWNIATSNPDALAERLGPFIAGRRWYRGKAQQQTGQHLRDTVLLEHGGERFLLVVLRIDYSSAPAETYVVPLAFVYGAAARDVEYAGPGTIVSRLTVEKPAAEEPEAGVLVDAMGSREFADRVLSALRASERIRGTQGELRFEGLAGLKECVEAGPVDPRPVELDQTNSLVFFGNQLVVKVLRVVDEGPNAEGEMTRFLSARSEHRLVPRALGTVTWAPRIGEPAMMAIASELVANRGTAWTLTQDALVAFFHNALASDQSAPERANLLPDVVQQMPAELRELADPLPALAELLARRTAELHLLLASERRDPAFAPEPLAVLYQQSLYQSARSLLVKTFAGLKRRLAQQTDGVRKLVEGVLAKEAQLDAALKDITVGQFDVKRIRCHGDLHLGQILFTGDDFVFLDFEGEPMRPLRERRFKRCVMRDVAGMIRSLHYTAEATLRLGRVRTSDIEALSPWARAWESWLSNTFLETYLSAVSASKLLPETRHATRRLLRFYLLEKCIYEIGYELNNRPDWLEIPVSGLERLLSAEWS